MKTFIFDAQTMYGIKILVTADTELQAYRLIQNKDEWYSSIPKQDWNIIELNEPLTII